MTLRPGLRCRGFFLAPHASADTLPVEDLLFQQDSPLRRRPWHFSTCATPAGAPSLRVTGSRPMPPLNATLWMLLVALLVAFFGWGVVRLTGRIERQRRTHGMTKDSRSLLAISDTRRLSERREAARWLGHRVFCRQGARRSSPQSSSASP
jgi:hypothetical protein